MRFLAAGGFIARGSSGSLSLLAATLMPLLIGWNSILHNYTGRTTWTSRRPRVGGADAVGQGREARLRRAERKQRPADKERQTGTDARRLVGEATERERADDEVSSTRLERETQLRALVHRERGSGAARAIEEYDII